MRGNNLLLIRVKLLILLLFAVSYVVAEQYDMSGFYFGGGTGVSVAQNYGLTKTYYPDPPPPDAAPNQYRPIDTYFMGNVNGYSIPIMLDVGYRFTNYFATEFTYLYSGNQGYARAPEDYLNSNFWGSQNYFGLTAVGYIPVSDSFYLKGRAGFAFSMDTMTTYAGNPGTGNFTTEFGLGVEWTLLRHMSLDFDYINFGWLKPMQLFYVAPANGGPNLGVINNFISKILC